MTSKHKNQIFNNNNNNNNYFFFFWPSYNLLSNLLYNKLRYIFYQSYQLELPKKYHNVNGNYI